MAACRIGTESLIELERLLLRGFKDETELDNEDLLHLVTAWLGNTEEVASNQYLLVTDDHFEQAQRHNVSERAQSSAAEISGQS